MAKRHRELLSQLDPVGLNRYQITESDVQKVEQYLGILQRPLKGASAWQDLLRYGGVYGTSILIHEVVELRILEARGLKSLRIGRSALQGWLAKNIEAHVYALYEEGLYLQEVLTRLYGQRFEVATLIKANSNDERDLELFLESEVGVFLLEADRVEAARQALEQLKEG